jgi:phospholipid-transporting ATPase
MSVCHTVVPEISGDTISYQASSPDEGALVRGAALIGYQFCSRRPDRMTIKAVSCLMVCSKIGFV